MNSDNLFEFLDFRNISNLKIIAAEYIKIIITTLLLELRLRYLRIIIGERDLKKKKRSIFINYVFIATMIIHIFMLIILLPLFFFFSLIFFYYFLSLWFNLKRKVESRSRENEFPFVCFISIVCIYASVCG